MIAEHSLDLTIVELAARYRDRELSPVDVTEAALERVARLEDSVHAFITLDPQRALGAARVAEAAIRSGSAQSPLCGVPISIKDMFAVAGLPRTCGSKAWTDRRPSETSAEAVELLERAGAVILGTNSLQEFAFGEAHPDFARSRNPWNLERTTLGSSTGSAAAVASRSVWLALTTDSGGSTRLPASACGVVGLKPTYGAVSRRGCMDLAPSLDHVGVLGRTAADVLLALDVIVSPSGSGPTWTGDDLADLRIGLIEDTDVQPGPEVRVAFEAAVRLLADFGARLEPVLPPALDSVISAHRTILTVEAAATHRHSLEAQGPGYSAGLFHRLEAGAVIRAVDYVEAQRVRDRFSADLDACFREVDFLACPTMGRPAYPIVEDVPGRDLTPNIRRTCQFNLTGHPAVSVPCGFTADGLPIGLQLIGPRYSDRNLLRLADVFQRATPWHKRRPAILDVHSATP